MNYNSAKNQRIKDEFVSKDVYCNVNSLVEPFIYNEPNENSPFTIDDVENLYVYPEFRSTDADFDGGTEEELQQEIRDLNSLLYNAEEELSRMDTDLDDPIVNEAKEKIADIESDIEELENLETEPQEIYEWWAVSGFLYEKLKEKGEPVLDAGSCYIWARTCTGQAISLDGVISEICNELNLLEK